MGNRVIGGLELTIVSLDGRGRITIPQDIRERLRADRFLVSLEEDGVHLVPVPDPRKAKASMNIPWSLEELEEAQEQHVLRRA